MNKKKTMRGFLASAAILATSLVGAFGLDAMDLAYQNTPGGGTAGGGGAGTATPPAPAKKWYLLKKEFMGKPAGEKLEMLETHAKTLVDDGTFEAVTEDPTKGLVDGVMRSVTARMQEVVDATLAEVVKQVKAPGFKGVNIEVKDRANAENDFGYENMGQYARDVALHSHKESPRTSDRMAKLVAHQAQTKDPTGMNTQTLEDGGILIPPTFSQTIFKRVFETSDILGALDTYTLSGNSIVFPRINEDSRATGSRSGGLRAYWVAEGDTVTASKMKFDRLSLALQKMMALAYVTQEQLDDGGNSLEKYLIDGISDEIQFLTLDSVIRGNGVGKPTGILNHASLITITQEAAQAAATLNANNISKMWSRLFLRSRAGANWYINQDVEPQLDLLALSIGTGGSTVPMYLPPGGLRDLPDGRLKGKAVKVIEHCETLGTVGDAILWDPGSYCFVTKGGVKTSMSMHLRFDYDEMVYKVTYRCNGMPWWPKALTPYKGTNTVGTAVVIETRAG